MAALRDGLVVHTGITLKLQAFPEAIVRPLFLSDRLEAASKRYKCDPIAVARPADRAADAWSARVEWLFQAIGWPENPMCCFEFHGSDGRGRTD